MFILVLWRKSANAFPFDIYSATLEPAHEFSSFKQQHEWEDGFKASYLRTFRDMDLFVEDAIRAIMEIEQKAKDLKQSLLQMRRPGIKNQYADHHARYNLVNAHMEEVAAEPSVQASTVNDERPCQTHHKPKLCFSGSLKSTIYTNKPLIGQTNEGIEIAICTDDGRITLGHLASLRVEIVALEKDHSCKGEWTEADFDRQIRKSRDGQGSVLDGECIMKLVNGKASLGNNIRFKEGSTGTRSREFVLAARVCRSENIGGQRVEEAFMDPAFSVLVERSKGNEKSSLPKLDDKIHDLKGIARNGPYARRLEKENIYTVQDFLKALNKDHNKLQKILEIKSLPSWEAIIRHARECDMKDRHELRSYKVETSNVSLLFNCIDGLVGAKFHGLYVVKEKFTAAQKVLVETHLQQAYSKLDRIPFDYVMENNQPIKISTNIDADYVMESNQPVKTSTNIDTAESLSIPTLLGGSPQNALGHKVTFQAAENLIPYGYGNDCVPDLPLGETNQNAAGQGVPDLPLGETNQNAAGSSELSHPVHCNGHTNQGRNNIPNHDTMPGCSFGATYADNVMEDNNPVEVPTNINASRRTSISTLLGASSQNASGNQVTFEATGSIRPFGDANQNAAGQQSASEPFRHEHNNGHVNQGRGQNCIPDPEGGMILPNSNANVGHADNMEEIWKLVEYEMLELGAFYDSI